jgi:hypothetical protein
LRHTFDGYARQDPSSPLRRAAWQWPLCIRRECLDNVVVLSEWHVRRILNDYFAHYHSWRCHQSLEMDCPKPRAVRPPEVGQVVEIREAGNPTRGQTPE